MQVLGIVASLILLLLSQTVFAEQQFLIKIDFENRYFYDQGKFSNTDQSETNLRIKPDYSYSWDNSRKVLQFTPYLLLSDPDNEKTHFDIREASFLGSYGKFELRAGISKVFWGVTESSHLVDIINQTDLVENVDGEDKLGQPMLALDYKTSFGIVSAYVLPYFRKRTFPGLKGRLRSAVVVDTDSAIFESPNKEKHTDVALRWEHSISYYDIGVSYFYGTSRDPILVSGTNTSGDPILIPHYQLIHQTGVDFQATFDAILVKHESIYRNYKSANNEDFYAHTTGFEYTFYSIVQSQTDLGVLVEYLFASTESNSLTAFTDSLFLALRFALNDSQSSEILAGGIFDIKKSTQFLNIEAKRRISPEITASLEIRQFIIDSNDNGSLAAFEKESYIQFEISTIF